ncbi:toxin-antitoxin system HicB family antitoxin [Paenibacillus larvae]
MGSSRFPFLTKHFILAKTKMANKDLAYYMALPYTIQIRPFKDESGSYYFATVAELDGCQSHGNTVQEAYAMIQEAMSGYIEVKLEHGDPIPEPTGEDAYSGRFNVRIPKTLHRQLAENAEREGISLNQYVLYKLSK